MEVYHSKKHAFQHNEPFGILASSSVSASSLIPKNEDLPAIGDSYWLLTKSAQHANQVVC